MKSEKIKIPAGNLVYAVEKIAKINKRAVKLGMKPMVLDIGDEFIETVDKIDYPFHMIEVSGEYPVINGWRIIGSIDHDENDFHLISTFGEFDVKRYRTMKPVCEHCNHHKITVKSFLVENVDSGNIKAVGRGCLKNYIDKDPKTMLNYLEWFSLFISEMEDEMAWRMTPVYSVMEVAEVASMAIRNWGFVKNSEDSPTAGAVRDYFFDSKFRRDNPTSEKDEEIAAEMIKSFVESESDSEFNFLIKSLIKKVSVEDKWFPHIAGAVFGYTLKVAREAERKVYEKAYVGEIKKRMSMNLTLESVKAIDGYYGISWIHNFVDDSGHKVTWFASNGDIRDSSDVEVGKAFDAMATPKKHEISKYDGNHVTYINRLKIS